MALPVEQWHTRDDTYECTEAEYISEVESDLFCLEGILINVVVQRLLETQTSLSKDKLQQVLWPNFIQTSIKYAISITFLYCIDEIQFSGKSESPTNELKERDGCRHATCCTGVWS